MEVVTLSDLAPILAAVVGPMLAVMFAMMRYQHADSVKTRNLMHELIGNNRDLIEDSKRSDTSSCEKYRLSETASGINGRQ